jgi:hypothetical protein
MELCIVTMLGIDTGTIDTDFSCFGLDLQWRRGVGDS